MTLPLSPHVVVGGAGLIGGSVALRCAALGQRVTVVDPDPATRTAAAEAGLEVGARVPADADLALLAVPLDAVAAVMLEVAAAAPDAVVADVGSVKSAPAADAGRAGLADRYVGLHPMAGTEYAGFAHASADLLVGATWAVARPVAPDLLVPVVAWVARTFDASVVVLDAAEHDRAAALISHVPHVLANALLGVVADDPTGLPGLLAAGSFRDTTRVAGTHAVRTRNMLADNADALDAALARVQDEVARYRALLAARDEEALLVRLAQVEHAAPDVRARDVAWLDCPDLDAVLRAPLDDGGAVLVRCVDDVWQWAPVQAS